MERDSRNPLPFDRSLGYNFAMQKRWINRDKLQNIAGNLGVFFIGVSVVESIFTNNPRILFLTALLGFGVLYFLCYFGGSKNVRTVSHRGWLDNRYFAGCAVHHCESAV